MSIIFPLFGTGTPQGITTDGYFRDGTDLKRIKSESFEIDTLFSNVDGFFVDKRENLYISQSGSIKKYTKNFATSNFSLVWQASGGFSGGGFIDNNLQSQIIYEKRSYPFISGFQSVAIDSQFNFYFRDTTDSNKLKKYSTRGQLITSTSGDIGAFAINKSNIISFIGNTVTKRDLSGNSISSFTVTDTPVALGSNQLFALEVDSQSFTFFDASLAKTIKFNTVRGYNLVNGNLSWTVNRITRLYFDQASSSSSNKIAVFFHNYIPMKNGNLLILCDVQIETFKKRVGEFTPQFSYILIDSTGTVLFGDRNPTRFASNNFNNAGSIANLINPDEITLHKASSNDPTRVTDCNQFIHTQGSNSDRSRLNF